MKEVSVIKTYNTNILGDGDRSVFGAVWNLYWINWDALTSINFLCLAYWKHELCSQQYSVSHVFIFIDWYRKQEFSCNFICFNFVYEFAVTLHFPHLCSKNCFAIGYFLYIPHFNSSFRSHYKPYKFPSEVFAGMFLWFKFWGILVHVRLLHLHVDAVFGELLKPAVYWNLQEMGFGFKCVYKKGNLFYDKI